MLELKEKKVAFIHSRGEQQSDAHTHSDTHAQHPVSKNSSGAAELKTTFRRHGVHRPAHKERKRVLQQSRGKAEINSRINEVRACVCVCAQTAAFGKRLCVHPKIAKFSARAVKFSWNNTITNIWPKQLGRLEVC